VVDILPKPYSIEGRQLALDKEIAESNISYVAKASHARMWFADRLKERDEMAAYGHLISEDTKQVILGYLGTEVIVDDYVLTGVEASGDSTLNRTLYVQWGFEERRHSQVFRHTLIDSGLYSQEFVDQYIAEVTSDHWTFKRQTGHEETLILLAAYAVFQERHTRWNYTNTRVKLWEEYGSPMDKNGRRLFPAAAGAIRYPEMDEGAHEANFCNIVRLNLKYFPEQTLDALIKVSKGYTMPIVQMPNGEEFLQAVLNSGLGNPRDIVKEVMTPSLNRMGLESKKALRKAIENYQNLPINCLVQLSGKTNTENIQEGFEVYEMLASGDFILKNEPVDSLPQSSK
jgi:hypothetical protein|tara:strand:- start:6568 stop:7596 length:1029 start_codon:yes stop_codon:yes gene_type:complete